LANLIQLADLAERYHAQFTRTDDATLLDEAIKASRAAIDIASTIPPVAASRMARIHFDLAWALRDRYRAQGRVGDIDDAILAYGVALGLFRSDDPLYPVTMFRLAECHYDRYLTHDAEEDLDRTIDLLARAAARLPDGHDFKPRALSDLGRGRLARFVRARKAVDLRRALSLARRAIELALPEPDPYLLETLDLVLTPVQAGVVLLDRDELIAAYRLAEACHGENRDIELVEALGRQLNLLYNDDSPDLDEVINAAIATLAVDNGKLLDHDQRLQLKALLGAVYFDRHNLTHAREDIDRSIALRREVAESTRPSDTHFVPHHLNLAQSAYFRFQSTRDLSDLDSAIGACERVIEAIPNVAVREAHALSRFVSLRFVRFDVTGRPEDLATARTAAQLAIDVLPEAPDRAELLHCAALAHLAALDQGGDIRDGDAAIASMRSAVELTTDDRIDRAVYLATLGRALHRRFALSARVEDLDESVETLEEAVATLVATDSDASGVATTLSNVLVTRFQRYGRTTDIDKAISVARTAAKHMLTVYGVTDATAMNNLGLALLKRYEHIGLSEDAHAAVEACRASVDATQPDAAASATHLANLGLALRARFEDTGDAADLAEAVESCRRAVAMSTGDADQSSPLSSLGLLLAKQYGLTGSLDTLNQAVEANLEALKATPAGHVDRALVLTNLGQSLASRFERVNALDDINTAVALLREAVRIAPNETERVYNWGNLSRALFARHRQTGELTDLDEAIDATKTCLELVSATHPERAKLLSSLGVVVGTRFDLAGDLADGNEALRACREAVARTPADSANRAGVLLNYAITLGERFDRDKNRALLDEARGTFREAYLIATAEAQTRLFAAANWGRRAGQLGDWADAVTGYSAAIELHQVVAWHGLTRSDRLHLIAQVPGVAVDAAAAAINTGNPTLAVELLEQGRGIVLAQTARVRDHHRTNLQDRAPDLAERMDQIRAELDAPEHAPEATGGITSWLPETVGRKTRRDGLAREWDSLVDRVRTLPGLADFLLPPAFSRLRDTAEHGPVVMVNVSGFRCDALVLRRGGVQLVPLPDLTAVDVRQRVLALLGARSPTDATVRDILAWLWDAIAEPVCAAIGLRGGASQRLARLWWCPTGLLSLLPLHAAGHYDPGDPSRNLMDRAVCSYTPTLQVLAEAARRPRDPVPAESVLVVGLPSTAGGRDRLDYADAELERLTGLLPGAATLRKAQATRANVLASLSTCHCLHFAGHGGQNPVDPDAAALLGYDHRENGPITIGDVAALRLRDARFAFLSACDTARGNVRLPDEAVHIAGALQGAGFTTIVGTQWSIKDGLAPRVAERVYQGMLTAESALDTGAAAVALHTAVGWLRARYPDRPAWWAPYVHFGP
jgi:tetratricopeptide (TPR) repeat protein